MEELRLWLDSYDDIYSDFDSRHYLSRRISEDFIHELDAALKTKTDVASELFLLLPENMRNVETEKAITTRLKEFFNSQFHLADTICRNKLHSGLIWLILGTVIMVINTYIGFKAAHSFPLVALKVLLEPAGWFMIWMSLDFLFYALKALKKEKNYYKALSEMNVHFMSWSVSEVVPGSKYGVH